MRRGYMKIKYALAVLCGAVISGSLWGQETVQEKSPAHFAGAYYTDSRGFDTASAMYSSKNLPYGLTFWGFIDFHGEQDLKGPNDPTQGSGRDFDNFFTENRITRMFEGGWGLQAEYNDANGSSNNVARFGVVYSLPIEGQFAQVRFFPVETDSEGMQASLVWKINLYEKKLFFEGFFDHTFRHDKTGSDRIVTEPQLRYMINDQLGVAVEYRVNEFLRSPTSRQHRKGTAVGMYYKF